MTSARGLLMTLVGRPLFTITFGEINVVREVGETTFLVETKDSPDGSWEPIRIVQDALDRLERDRRLKVTKESLGHWRTSLIGAILLELDGVEVESTSPRVIRLGRQSGDQRSLVPRTSVNESWIRFEGYEGRYDAGYGGAYRVRGFRFPYVEATRTWDIVRVDSAPVGGVHPSGSFAVVSRRYDMMGKAYDDFRAYRLHFKRCAGVGVCEDIGHPGGPKRSRAQALKPREAADL